MLIPKDKIKVFISSACGNTPERQKYNIVRAGLKTLIEATHFAEVYVFESEVASTISAGQHYSYAIEDYDVCIFLIDNADGVPDGVQKEINTAKKLCMKSLYYFCDQVSKEQTPLQKSLIGSQFEKSITVHSFEEFIEHGAADLLSDLTAIYRHYCKGRLVWNEYIQNQQYNDALLDKDFSRKDYLVPQNIFSHIDKCKNYFSLLITEKTIEISETNALDDLCCKFLAVLFEGKSIREYDISLLVNEIAEIQSVELNTVIRKRWEGIQEYFLGSLDKCVAIFKEALDMAKATSVPDWILKDMLIDLRNENGFLDESQNIYTFEDEFQKELNSSEYLLIYPVLDRFENDLYEALTNRLFENEIESPHTITLHDSLSRYTDILANIFVMAISSGSLTQLHMLYKRIQLTTFCFCQKYSNWNLKKLILKTSIVINKKSDEIVNHYAEILCHMNSSDAKEIFDFSNNIPIPYRKFIANLQALKVVGYFLNDDDFSLIWIALFEEIKEWIQQENSVTVVGSYIYRTLQEVCNRIDPKEIALICCLTIENTKRRFYDELFKLIAQGIDINKLSNDLSTRLLDNIIAIIQSEDERNHIRVNRALIHLRNQNSHLTEDLDRAIYENMRDFYNGDYKLDTTNNEINDMPEFIKSYIVQIYARNKTQGINGYSGYSDMPHSIIGSIMRQSTVSYDIELLDSIFCAACDTILQPRQTVDEKIDALKLLIYLCNKFPELISRNSNIVDKLHTNYQVVESGKSILSNLNNLHLRLAALLLYSSLGKDVLLEIVGILAEFGDDDVISQIQASKTILSFLEAKAETIIGLEVNCIFLEYSLKWCNSATLDVRWNAVRILFHLISIPNYRSLICNQLVKLMDKDNVYIKNSIIRKADVLRAIDKSTYDYILQKASLDTNYMVRLVYSQVAAS